MLSLTSLGAAGMMAGSKHLIHHDEGRLLVDCGLFQGTHDLGVRNWQRLHVPHRQSTRESLALLTVSISGMLLRR